MVKTSLDGMRLSFWSLINCFQINKIFNYCSCGNQMKSAIKSRDMKTPSKEYQCPFHLEKLFIQSLRTLGLILLYYTFSIGITFYQKWFIKKFHFPLTVVSCHLFVKYFLAYFIRVLYKLITGVSRISVSWPVYIRRLAGPGIASALDIGFSNWSFEFITISLYTMTKSTCIIFILIFAISFDLEKFRCSLIAVVLLISIGLFMFTYHSTQFELKGFLLVLSASFLGGLRWTLAQLVMQRKDCGLSNPLDMIYWIQPSMIIGLLPLTLLFEVVPAITNGSFYYSLGNDDSAWTTTTYIISGSLLAFFMELSEYLLLTYTSSLTLSIAGIFKEVFTLYLAVEYNGDTMSLINLLGLGVCVTGISLHVLQKAIDASGEATFKNKRIDRATIESESLLDNKEETFF